MACFVIGCACSEEQRALNRPNRECPRSFAYGECVLSHADDGVCPDFAFEHRELGRHVRSVDWVERFAREAGFEIVLCAPRTPETKGKVESANRSLSRLTAYEGDFDGWEGIDAAIAHIERRSNEEPNDTTGVPPELLFMREKDALRPLGKRALRSGRAATSRSSAWMR